MIKSKWVLCMLTIIALLFVVQVLWAESAKESTGGKMFEGVTVNAAVCRTDDADYMVSGLAPKLKDLTGMNLVVDVIPYEELRAKQLTDRVGAKRYDILGPCTEWSYEYREFGYPLNEYIGKEGYPDIEQEDIIPYVWNEFNPGKDIHWLPYQPDTRVFFYREDMLKEAGISVPKTWDELLAAAKKLTKDTDGDGQPDVYGFVFQGRRGWNLTLSWIPFVFAAGGEMFVDGKPAFNNQASIDAINLLLKLKKFGPPDIDAYGEQEVNMATKTGIAAMGVNASGITNELEAPDSPVKGMVTTTLFPVKSGANRKYTAILGGWALGVSEYSKNKDAAAYAVMWLTSRPIVTEMQINGRQHAARLSMANNAELLKANPHASTIVDILGGSTLFYKGPEGSAIGELLNLRIAQAISGELTPQQALDAAEEDINKLLAQ